MCRFFFTGKKLKNFSAVSSMCIFFLVSSHINQDGLLPFKIMQNLSSSKVLSDLSLLSLILLKKKVLIFTFNR